MQYNIVYSTVQQWPTFNHSVTTRTEKKTQNSLTLKASNTPWKAKQELCKQSYTDRPICINYPEFRSSSVAGEQHSFAVEPFWVVSRTQVASKSSAQHLRELSMSSEVRHHSATIFKQNKQRTTPPPPPPHSSLMPSKIWAAMKILARKQ